MKPFVLIAGPCVLEPGMSTHLIIAREIARIAKQWPQLTVYFKASFLKANRTRREAPRGPGREVGLEMLTDVRQDTGLRLITDVHEVDQVNGVAQVCDAIQIPAFLCRQTELIEAVAGTKLPANIKKGQMVGPTEMLAAAEKFSALSDAQLMVSERGTFFGYGDLVVDFRNVPLLQAGLPAAQVLYDGTHSMQHPGRGTNGKMLGLCQVPMIQAAVALGVDGLFLEVHPDPLHSPSDADTMLPLDALAGVIRKAMLVRGATEHWV